MITQSGNHCYTVSRATTERTRVCTLMRVIIGTRERRMLQTAEGTDEGE